MRTNFDFSPFRRSTVGFDQLFDLLEGGAASQVAESYPPFDIEHDGEDAYRITLAVAGFRPEDVEITAQRNQLIVSGRRPEAGNDGRYIHKGIAGRSFERRFALGDFIKVRGADLRDGLLSIQLVREIPEAMKPHKISINTGDQAGTIEQRAQPTAENENSETAKSSRAA